MLCPDSFVSDCKPVYNTAVFATVFLEFLINLCTPYKLKQAIMSIIIRGEKDLFDVMRYAG